MPVENSINQSWLFFCGVQMWAQLPSQQSIIGTHYQLVRLASELKLSAFPEGWNFQCGMNGSLYWKEATLEGFPLFNISWYYYRWPQTRQGLRNTTSIRFRKCRSFLCPRQDCQADVHIYLYDHQEWLATMNWAQVLPAYKAAQASESDCVWEKAWRWSCD